MGKKLRFRDFRFKMRFKKFWIDSNEKKIFDQNFLTLPFFHYFGQKMTKSQKEIRNGKKFRFWDFRFKIRFKTFKSIPTKKVKKIFRPKFFDLAIFSLFWPKNECPRKNFVMGKNFRFRDFRFKISLKTFWIDSEKNFLRPKMFKNFHFDLWQAMYFKCIFFRFEIIKFKVFKVT